jgi:tetratricopeptide (TPR) repeat protein
MKSIELSMQSDKPAYFQSAGYYYNNNKDLNKALEWVNKAIELNPKGYFIVMLKSRIQYKLNDFSGAHASAQQVVTLAKDAKNEEYIKLGEKMISDTKGK